MPSWRYSYDAWPYIASAVWEWHWVTEEWVLVNGMWRAVSWDFVVTRWAHASYPKAVCMDDLNDSMSTDEDW